MFCKSELKAKLAQNEMNVSTLASKIGVDTGTLYRKMAGETSFSVGDIESIRDVLELEDRDIISIFFAPETSNHATFDEEVTQ